MPDDVIIYKLAARWVCIYVGSSAVQHGGPQLSECGTMKTIGDLPNHSVIIIITLFYQYNFYINYLNCRPLVLYCFA